MKRSTRRSRRLRNPQQDQKEQPFFSKSADHPVQAKEEPFFQTKLTVGKPGDKYEKEADAAAESVVSGSQKGPAVQRQGLPGIQRYMTNPKEDEMGTNTQRIEKDKYIQEKPELQRMDKEKEVQKQGEEGAPKEEEQPEAQMKKEEEEAMPQAKKEEEVQKQGEEGAPKEEEKTTGAPGVQSKTEGGQPSARPPLSSRLEKSKGGGRPLSPKARAEMEHAFGVEFSGVRVHTDRESVGMNRQLRAQAFTHGKDIYFNTGKYNPDTSQGKRLLAHELTHVIQQKGDSIRRKPLGNALIQRSGDGKISTPLPAGSKPNPRTGEVKMIINGLTVIIRPDKVQEGLQGAETAFDFDPSSWSYDGYEYDANGIVTKVNNPPTMPQVIIQTTYGKDSGPEVPSAYGKGTTEEDKAVGTTSLGHHEGSHGSDYLNFLRNNPYPAFPSGVGMQKDAFAAAVQQYKSAREAYSKKMEAFSAKRTDCIGTSIDEYKQFQAPEGTKVPKVCD
ncbi:MAG: DUF4157 domain-containing protein [Phaeodactylibacter sp.]|nr:DUF4157 domain-containing protein [Phaeodactylibacter sp.]